MKLTASFALLIYLCFQSSSGLQASQGEPLNTCLSDPSDCQDNALEYLPKHKALKWKLDLFWEFAMRDQEANLFSEKTVLMEGLVSVTRISRCRLRIGFTDINLDEGNSKTFSGSTTIVVVGRSIRQVCTSEEGEVDSRLIHLSSSVASSLFERPQHATVVAEDEGLGPCETTYSTESPSTGTVKKRRNFHNCYSTYQQLGGEAPHPVWVKSSMDKFEGYASYECNQIVLNGVPNNIVCQHNVSLQDFSKYASEMKLEFISSENVALKTEVLKEIDREAQISLEDESSVSHMKTLCQNLDTGLSSEALSSLPQILSKLQRMSMSDIITLYSEVKQGILCPANEVFLPLLSTVLRSVTSPAAASAKCQLMQKGIADLDKGWALSLANVEAPNENTLRECIPILNLPNLNEGILGLSSLAVKVSKSQCPSSSQYGCHFGDSYNTFATSLYSKAINCLNPREQYQRIALWAIKGLGKLHPATNDVTPTLRTCASSPSASKEVLVASLQALGSKQCVSGTAKWLRDLVINNTLDSELRIEAFRSLHTCDWSEANSLLRTIAIDNVDMGSNQVTSYLSSYSGNDTSWNTYLKLSQHLNVNLTDWFGFPNGSKLEGDLVFEDSFLPRSIELHLKSKLLKIFGESLKIGIRQDNLQDVLQPLVGPGGVYGGIHDMWQSALTHIYKGLGDLFKTRGKEESNKKSRDKRSLNIEDVKEAIKPVKTKVRESLNGWISAEFGKESELFLPFSATPLLTKIDKAFQQWVDDFTNTLYGVILDSKLETGYSWNLRNSDAFSWTFFGPILRIRQQEGVVALLKGSSHVNLLSLMKSPFSPTIDIKANPNLGAFKLTSMDLFTPDRIYRAQSDSSLTSSFDVSIRIKPQKLEHIEMKLDFLPSAFNGYSFTETKKLVACIPTKSYKDAPNTLTGPAATHPGQQQCEEVGDSDKIDEEAITSCIEDLIEAVALRVCSKKRSTKSSSIYNSRTLFTVQKDHDDIDYFKLSFSSKNPGQDSVFFSTVMETVGLVEERKSTFIFGFIYSPHMTLKMALQGGTKVASFETSIVNDPNLKRLESRSTFAGEEYGLKAEVLMVQDGGQVSVKPRLVVSRPWAREDSLLEGYLAHYSSDKVKSFTLDIATDGSLKKFVDATFKGTTEFRRRRSGEWSVSFKNLHMSTPEVKMGLEASLDASKDKKELQAQVTIDDDVIMLGGSFESVANSSEGGDIYGIAMHFLAPAHPEWATKLNVDMAIDHQEVRNNLTIENGPEDNRWEFFASHSTSWEFLYSGGAVAPPESLMSVWSALLHPKRASKIDSNVKLSIPTKNFDWTMTHFFESSDKSLENKVYLNHGGDQYTIMANFYDQSEELFRYHMEIESDFPEWEFSYVDTLLQRTEGDIVGQSTTKMPSGRIYSSSSRIKYKSDLDTLSLELSHDTLVKEASNSWRISARHTLEHTNSNLNFLATLDAPEPLFNLEFSAERLDTNYQDYYLKSFMKNNFEGELSFGNTGSQLELEVNFGVIPMKRQLKGKVALERRFSGGGAFEGEVSWLSTQDPFLAPITIKASSMLEIEAGGKCLLKSEINLMGSKWTAEMRTELGKDVDDKKELILLLIFPDKLKFEAKARLQINIQRREKRSLDIYFLTKMPHDTVYEFSIRGEHKSRRGRISDARLFLFLDTPFTQEVIFNSSVLSKYNIGIRTFSLDVNTYSQAEFWRPIDINLLLMSNPSNIDLSFDGKVNNQTFSLNFLGSYKHDGNSTDLKVSSEVKLPNNGTLQQLKASIEGTVVKNVNSKGIKVFHKSFVEKNLINVFTSNGELDLQVPRANGKLIITHNCTSLVKQEYDLKGKYTGGELEVSVKGIVDYTPVRIQIHYIDGNSFTAFASYGGESYTSVEFRTKLKKFSLGLKKKEEGPAKLTTAGIVIYKGRKTRFFHILKMDDRKTVANLRIQSISGRPLKITAVRTKRSKSHYKSEVKMLYGQRKVIYRDSIDFKSIREFDIEGSFAAPSFGVRKNKISLFSSHKGIKDQTVTVVYSKDGMTIHGGRIEVETTLLRNLGPWEIEVLLKNAVIDRKRYRDFKLSQNIHFTQGTNLRVKTSLTNGQVKLSEFAIEISNSSRQISFTLCSQEKKCIKLKAEAQALSLKSPLSNFIIEFSSLNSLFVNNLEDGLQLQTLELFTENKIPEDGDLKIYCKLSRSRCSDLDCSDPHMLTMHHMTLTVAKQKLDLQYETTQRTVAIRTQLYKDSQIIEKLGYSPIEKDSSTLQIEFWFDRAQRPQERIIWNTTYASSVDGKAHFIETIEITISHPQMTRPLRIEGKLVSSMDNIKRDVSIDLEVFDDPTNDLRITAIKDSVDERHIFIAKLQNPEQKKLYMSLTALAIPSADNAQVDLRAVVTKDGETSTTEDEVRFKCKAEDDKLEADFTCELSSPSFNERCSLGYSSSPGCSGSNAYSNVFDETYRAYAKHCFDLPSIQYGISLNGNKVEKFAIEAGLVDSTSFHMTLFDLMGAAMTLHPPFLLHLSYNKGSHILDTWDRFQSSISNEVNFLLSKTKNVANKVYEDSSKLVSRLEVLQSPSPIINLGELFKVNMENAINELRSDELMQDAIHLVKASADIASDGFLYIADHLNISCLHLDIFSEISFAKIEENVIGFIKGVSEIFWRELNNIVLFGNDLMESAASYVKVFVEMVTDHATLRHPIAWIKSRISSLTQLDLTRFSFKLLEDFFAKSLWVASFIYPEIQTDKSVISLLVPLPESSFTLMEMIEVFKGSSPRPEYKKTLEKELVELGHLAASPEEFVEKMIPPYQGHAVVLPGGVITLDGKVSHLDPECAHLLLVTTSRNFKRIALASGPVNATRKDARREMVLIYGDDVIKLSEDFEMSFNSLSVWLPFAQEDVHLSRDLDSIRITLTSDKRIEILSLICPVRYNGCVVLLNGWLSKDVAGLLSNFDGNPSNEFFQPKGKATSEERTWESSWGIGMCSPGETPDVLHNSWTDYLCRKALLGYQSSLLPCHDEVEISPYYNLCKISFLDFKEGLGSTSHRPYHQRGENLTAEHNRKPPSTRYKPYEIVSGANLDEASTLCDIMSSYTTVCRNLGMDMSISASCEGHLEPFMDVQIDHSVQIDILLLIERAPCLNFLQDQLLSKLPDKMAQLLPKTNISALIGAMGYGSSSGKDLIFYGKSSRLLVPLPDFISPDVPSKVEEERGTLYEALQTIKLYPFRRGSVRVALVVACSSQDLPFDDAELLSIIKDKRVLVYSLVPDKLLLDQEKPKAIRNVIGMDSKYLYHLKRQRIAISSNWRINKPTSNIAQMALKSGGGVFSVSSIQDEKKSNHYMSSFRDILSKTMLFFSRQSHTWRAAE